MLIAQLDITNFRGIREGRVRFGTFTVLIGANNCGKTTITEALALLLRAGDFGGAGSRLYL
jgi:putative ATP-dependent endonuclease of the OLD family